MGTFWTWDVLGLGTFWGLRHFEAWDVVELGRFGVGSSWGLGCFVAGTFWGWDVL